MRRLSKKLTDLKIRKAIKEGKRALIDGDGLRLVIKENGAASWVFRIKKDGREYNIGLGSYPRVTIAKARDKAQAAFEQIDDGKDPIAEKQKRREIPSFENASREYYKDLSRTFRNIKHSKVWISSLESYAFPKFGKIRVDKVTQEMVFNLISSLWLIKNETAKRVKQRVIAVIDWAVMKGYRSQGIAVKSINSALPKYDKQVVHLPSLPYDEMPGVMSNIRDDVTIGRLALEFAILTAARSREVRFAKWSQIDFANKVWIKPPEIMKKGLLHITPLSEAALNVLSKIKLFQCNSDVIFTGKSKEVILHKGTGEEEIISNIISENTMLQALKPLANGYDVTTHGFRGTFRNWARDMTHSRDDVAEQCLAHSIGDEVTRAYLTTDLMNERRQLLDLWADYCDGKTELGANVIEFKKG